MVDEQTPRPEPENAQEAQMEYIQDWFGSHARDWTNAYRNVRRVNDLVLIDRKNITLAFVRTHVGEGGRILDAGCGAGWAALDLARAGYSVHGVDIAQEMIDQCEQTFAEEGLPADEYVFTCGDVLRLDLPPESFDGIVALGFLQYQVAEEQLLERFHALLRPGGLLVVTGPIERGLPNYFGVLATGGALVRRILQRRREPSPTRHRYSRTRFQRLLSNTGFDLVGHRGHGFGDWVVVGSLIGFRGELLLHRFFTRLAAFTSIGLWGNDLVIAGRKRRQ